MNKNTFAHTPTLFHPLGEVAAVAATGFAWDLPANSLERNLKSCARDFPCPAWRARAGFRSSLLAGLLVATLALPSFLFADDSPAATAKEPQKPLVQIALLLDTSNSMDGLIDQAKSQLWKICNEFIKARQNGVAPEVQVALYEYGNSRLSPVAGWIRQVVPLTTDLDRISEELFALRTSGGDEFCGWVIQRAVEELAWNPSADVYKAIFIAGNEPFTQGPVNYADSCKAAIAKGIIVNTIHCGSEAVGVNTKWKDGADLADGKYMVIDQNRAVVAIAAPQDAEIARLGVELNKTYLAYGAQGRVGAARQAAQEANVAMLAPASGATVQRALTKASANYLNAGWDLVDAAQEKDFDIAKLKTEDLPEPMRKMNESERKAFIEKHARERAEIRAKINQLNAEREKYLKERMKEFAGTNTLDAVIIAAIREQAQKRNFQFE